MSLATAMACLVVNDTMMKYVGQSMGVPQLILLRGFFAVLMVLAVAHGLGATPRLREVLDRRVATRAAIDAAGTLLYLASLMHLPIANATAINLSAPLIIVVFAFLFLHERAGLQRWFAVGAGFAGVVLVIQPRVDGFTAYALLCLAGTVFQAGRELLTRRIDPGVPSIVVTLASVACVTLVAAVLTLLQGWRMVTLSELGLLAAAAALLATGYYLVVNSMRHGELTLVAPFRYTSLLVAVLMGYAVWGEVPNALAWSGIALLLASGIYLLHGERRRNQAESKLRRETS